MKMAKRITFLTVIMVISFLCSIAFSFGGAFASTNENVRMEAEDGIIHYGKVCEDIEKSSGFSIKGLNEKGAEAFIQWNVVSTEAKTVGLTLCYKTEESATGKLSVNGAEEEIAFFATERNLKKDVSLISGENTIILKSVSSDLVEIDYIEFDGSGISQQKGEPIRSKDGTNTLYYAKDAMLNMATVKENGTFNGAVEYVSGMTYSKLYMTHNYPDLGLVGENNFYELSEIIFNVDVEETDYYRVRIYYSTAATDYAVIRFKVGAWSADLGLGSLLGEGVFSEDVYYDAFSNLSKGENLVRISCPDVTRSAQIVAIEVRKCGATSPLRVEAESSLIENGTVTEMMDASFAGAVTFAENGSVEFNVKAPAAGKYVSSLIWRGAENAVVTVSANGTKVTDFVYTGTGEFTVSSVALPLVEGNNAIVVSGIATIDALEIAQGVTAGDCVLEVETSAMEGGVILNENNHVFSGKQYVFFTEGDAQWTIDVEEEGDYKVSLRTFQTEVNAIELSVNEILATTVTPASAGVWINTNTVIHLKAGKNILSAKLTNTYIDCVIINAIGVERTGEISRIQAEDATIKYGLVQKDDGIGGYQVAIFNPSLLTWTLQAEESGDYFVAVHYFSFNNLATGVFTVNGTAGARFDLPQLGYWAHFYTTVSLQKGLNIVQLSVISNDNGADVYFDYLDVYGSVSLVEKCIPTENATGTGHVYEAEQATINLAEVLFSGKGTASGQNYVNIGQVGWNYFVMGQNPYTASAVIFDKIYVEKSGTYTLKVFYDGIVAGDKITYQSPEVGSDFIIVNGGAIDLILSKEAYGYDDFRQSLYYEKNVYLVAGYNHIRIGAFTGGVDIDCIEVIEGFGASANDVQGNNVVYQDERISLEKDSSVLLEFLHSKECAYDIEIEANGTFELFINGTSLGNYMIDGMGFLEKELIPSDKVVLELKAVSDVATFDSIWIDKAELLIQNQIVKEETSYRLEAEYGKLTKTEIQKGETSNSRYIVLKEDGSAVYSLPAFEFDFAKLTFIYQNIDATKVTVTIGEEMQTFIPVAGENFEKKESVFCFCNTAQNVTVTVEGGSIAIDKIDISSAHNVTYLPSEMVLHQVSVGDQGYEAKEGSFVRFDVSISMRLTTSVTIKTTEESGTIALIVGGKEYTATLIEGETTIEKVAFIKGLNTIKVVFHGAAKLTDITINKCGGEKPEFSFKNNEKGSGFIVNAEEGLFSEAEVKEQTVLLNRKGAWAKYNMRVIFAGKYTLRITLNNTGVSLVKVNGAAVSLEVANGGATTICELQAENNEVVIEALENETIEIVSIEALYDGYNEKYVRYEAELGERVNCNVQGYYGVPYGEYSYTGFVADIDLPDSSLMLRVYAERDGVYKMRFAYATLESKPTFKMYNNSYKGSEKEYTITCSSPTSNWGIFRVSNTTIELKKGWNEILFVKGEGHAQLDYVEIGEWQSDFPSDNPIDDNKPGDGDYTQKTDSCSGCGSDITAASGLLTVIMIYVEGMFIWKKRRGDK